jgi:hypothetical protein
VHWRLPPGPFEEIQVGIALIGVSAASGALTFSAPVVVTGNAAEGSFAAFESSGFFSTPIINAPQTGAVITPDGGAWCSAGMVVAFLPNLAAGANPVAVQAADGVTPLLFGSVVVGP